MSLHQLELGRSATGVRVRNAVGAAPIARNDMLDAFHRYTGPKRGSKEVELARTKAFTNRRGGTDGAMVFDKQEGPAGTGLDLCHIPLSGSDAGKPTYLFFQRRRMRYPRHIIGALFCGPGLDHPPETIVAKSIGESVDQIDAQFRIGVRE